MASIQNRGPHQWQATVRRKGYPSQSKTCKTKRDAEAWANKVEHKMASGGFINRKKADRTTPDDGFPEQAFLSYGAGD